MNISNNPNAFIDFSWNEYYGAVKKVFCDLKNFRSVLAYTAFKSVVFSVLSYLIFIKKKIVTIEDEIKALMEKYKVPDFEISNLKS